MYSFSRGVGSGVWKDRGVTTVFEPRFRAIVLLTGQYGPNQCMNPIEPTFLEEYSCARASSQALYRLYLQDAGFLNRDEAEVIQQYELQVQ